MFGSKDGLLGALGVRAFNVLQRELEALPATDQPLNDLVEAALIFRRFALEHPALFSIAFHRADPAISPRFRAARMDALAALQMRFEPLADADLLGGRSVAEAAMQFHALCEGAAWLELRGNPLTSDPERFWRNAFHALITGFAAPAPRPPPPAARGPPARSDDGCVMASPWQRSYDRHASGYASELDPTLVGAVERVVQLATAGDAPARPRHRDGPVIACKVRSAFPTAAGGAAPTTPRGVHRCVEPRALQATICLQIHADRLYEPYALRRRQRDRGVDGFMARLREQRKQSRPDPDRRCCDYRREHGYCDHQGGARGGTHR